jgi:serine/threonine protein kinase
LYIVLGFCDDCNLNQYVERLRNEKRFVTEEFIWQFAYQFLNGLDYLHNYARETQIIVHRDLSINNIFFSKDGKIRLGDFGFVQILDRDNPNGIEVQPFEKMYCKMVPPR